MLAVDSGMSELPAIGSGIGLGIGAGAAMAIVLDGMCRVNALLFCFDGCSCAPLAAFGGEGRGCKPCNRITPPSYPPIPVEFEPKSVVSGVRYLRSHSLHPFSLHGGLFPIKSMHNRGTFGGLINNRGWENGGIGPLVEGVVESHAMMRHVTLLPTHFLFTDFLF